MRGIFVRGALTSQRGLTVLMALLTLIAVMLIGVSAAQLALQGEQAARGERDRHIAFQSAEDALADAENDIGGADPAGDGGPELAPRSAMFAPDAGAAFAGGCGAGEVAGAGQGLHALAEGGAPPAWQRVDLSGGEDGGRCSVQFGAFTSAAMQTGEGFLPFRRPRYVIERLPCHEPGDDASTSAPPSYCYRVSAIGFGAQPATEVVLQSVFRKKE